MALLTTAKVLSDPTPEGPVRGVGCHLSPGPQNSDSYQSLPETSAGFADVVENLSGDPDNLIPLQVGTHTGDS